MITIPNKTKQFLVLIAKLLVVGGAFYFIYSRLAATDTLNWKEFKEIVFKKNAIWSILFVLFLSFLNRFLEILKWQNLVQVIKPITIGEATKQVLGSLTLGLFTPNGIGEYAGKALFFEKVKTKKVIFLNLVCNGVQLVLTVVLGVVGLLYFNTKFEVISDKIVLVLFGSSIMVVIGFFFLKRIVIKGFSLEKLVQKLNEIPKSVHQRNTILGFLRYVTFSHQYYFLFFLFGVHSSYGVMMAAITSVYFLASSLPSFQFLDFAVKGGVAVFFFSLLGVKDWIPVFISTLMWFLNTVIPVFLGSYYVLNFKSQWKS